MLTKTKIALVAALVASSASVALAQDFDPNLANRYPAYAGPVATSRTFQSAPVRLHSAPVLQQRDVSLPSAASSSPAGPLWYGSSGPTSGGM
jgi:hypothetical protein